jgi:phage gp36-like protein
VVAWNKTRLPLYKAKMAFTDIIKLKKYLPVTTIEQLTDDHKIGKIVTEVVDAAIEQAHDMLSAWINGRYSIDMTYAECLVAAPFLSDLETRLAVYCLYKRKLYATMPEAITKDYESCISTLRMIQKGEQSPYTSGEPEIIVCNKTDDSRTYTSSKWSQYD